MCICVITYYCKVVVGPGAQLCTLLEVWVLGVGMSTFELQSLSYSPVQNFENWHLHQVENVELWTEANHPHCPLQVKAATKIQAIARVRARKQEQEKALKGSHARVQSCDNSQEARIKSEQTMIMSDTLITDSEFSKMLSAGSSVRDSTFHDSHAEDNWRNRNAACVQNLIYF